jgi:zinc/manganese transport system substrate-binding protein
MRIRVIIILDTVSPEPPTTTGEPRPPGSVRRPAILGLLALLLVALGAPASASAARATHASSPLRVVAAENVWGSIASQLAGSRATVSSIIVNPDTDPHDYEPTASDARTMASATFVIVNGIGYDEWASRLLDANPVSRRVTLDVGDLLGLKDGDNPHQWYSPVSVTRVVTAIVAGYDRLDPADTAYFAARRRHFEAVSLAPYHRLVRQIRTRFAGVPVGYSESIFQPLGQALGLKLLTPYSFAKAVAEGTEISAGDKQTVDRQAARRQIRVWVYNSQNATPDVQQINAIARARKIPIATVTETLSPASDTFEQWQVAELQGLIRALHQATGR